jgi:hypothetical protein
VILSDVIVAMRTLDFHDHVSCPAEAFVVHQLPFEVPDLDVTFADTAGNVNNIAFELTDTTYTPESSDGDR